MNYRVDAGHGQGPGRRQRGAALLAFMLVVIVGSSFMLVSRLNEFAQAYARTTQTRETLATAKRALLAYAMNYPDLEGNQEKGPGFLPCPDQDDDGSAQTSCTFNTATSTYSTLGLLPYRNLGIPELRDSNGEHLWYALSANYRYSLTNNQAYVNSETPGALSVDGTDDVVAVIIAPGQPVTGQTGRRGASETAAKAGSSIYQVADQYLEGENAAYDDTSFVTTGSGEFNDQVVTITRAELMKYVEKRVLEETRKALTAYRNTAGAFPWLAPFADPKADTKWVKGEHSGSDNSSSLVDSSADFADWGVSSGDLVWNVTDGSVGTVSAPPSATTLTISGLSGGTDNDFDGNDAYVIEMKGLHAILSGTATGGSSSLTLEDTTRDFDTPLVAPGDIVDDITDGSSGRVASVSDTTLTVAGLSGGTQNVFSAGDAYRIRSNTGTATGGSSGTTLEDTSVNFQSSGTRPLGVQVGDLVRNLTDGSYGIVSSIPTSHTLTVSSLSMGSANAFTSGNVYAFSRYAGVTNTSQGLLPVQQAGAAFPTAFTMDWNASSVDVNGGTDPLYNAAVSSLATASANYVTTVSVPKDSGQCYWVDKTVADCRGVMYDYLSGAATGWAGGTLSDSLKYFAAQGVKVGDKISNESVTPNLNGIVTGVGVNSLQVTDITGYTNFSASVGDKYRVSVATDKLSATAALCILPLGTAYTATSLTGVQTGDVIADSTAGNAVGLVTGTSSFCVLSLFPLTFSANGFTYTSMKGGSRTSIFAGDALTFHSNYAQRRDIEFRVRFKGNEAEPAPPGGDDRTRTVCLGYDLTCTSATSATFPQNTVDPKQISVVDYDATTGGSEVASASAPATAGASGSLRISGIEYALTTDDLPEWYFKNRWYQQVYVAYAGGYGPGGAGSCTAGTDCLTVSVQEPWGTTAYNNRAALVMTAGPQLGAQIEDRTSGDIDAYFESGNASTGDDSFEKGEITTSFNDQVRVITP